MSQTQVYSALSGLNLPSKYIDNLFSIWYLELSTKLTLPTKSEVLGFYKKGIIDKVTVTQELSKLGYNKIYISWYLGASEVAQG